MTLYEAEERATAMYGDRIAEIWRDRLVHAPGRAQWYIETVSGGQHALDVNGHAVCHAECSEVEP